LLEVLGAGDVIEIPSLPPDIHHKLSLEAFTNCQIGLVSPSELVEGIVGISLRKFNEALSLTICRWWKLLERHSNFLNQTVRERLAIALLDLARKLGAATRPRGTHRSPPKWSGRLRPGGVLAAEGE
jgi:hypothetical protein